MLNNEEVREAISQAARNQVQLAQGTLQGSVRELLGKVKQPIMDSEGR